MSPKDQWRHDFSSELFLRLRPELGLKMAETIAGMEWVKHKDVPAVDAARRWAAKNPPRPRAR